MTDITNRTLMGFEYQDIQTLGTEDTTRIWTTNFNNGTDWRESGFNTQYETQTHTTTANIDTLRIFEAQPTNYTVGTADATGPTTPITYRTTDLNIQDVGSWTTGSNFVTDEQHLTGNTAGWNNVYPFITENPKLLELFERLTDKEKEKLTEYQLEKYDAKIKSEKLLKRMLSKKEYDSLKLHGEMEIQDPRDQDVIFIVRKQSHAMVERKVKGKYKDRHCIVPNPVHELPIGDEILQKVLLLKAAPKIFEEIAIVHA